MNNDPLYMAMVQLIAGGRLTGVTPALALDGVVFQAAGDDSVEPHDNVWNADGTSHAVNEYGGQMLEKVEALRKNLTAQGGVAADVAQRMPQWFGRVNAEGSLSAFQHFQLNQNHNHWFFSMAYIGGSQWASTLLMPFNEFKPPYIRDDGAPLWSLEGVQSGYKRGVTGPVKQIANMRSVVSDHATPDEVAALVANWAEAEIKGAGGDPSGVDFSPARG